MVSFRVAQIFEQFDNRNPWFAVVQMLYSQLIYLFLVTDIICRRSFGFLQLIRCNFDLNTFLTNRSQFIMFQNLNQKQNQQSSIFHSVLHENLILLFTKYFFSPHLIFRFINNVIDKLFEEEAFLKCLLITLFPYRRRHVSFGRRVVSHGRFF